MKSFSKSDRSNHPAGLYRLAFTVPLACFAGYCIWKGNEVLGGTIGLLFFALLTVIVIRDFFRPYTTTLDASVEGLAISLSNKGRIYFLPWSNLKEIELVTDDGVALYVREVAGSRHKLSKWVSLTEDEIGVILNIAAQAAPTAEILQPKKIIKPVW